MFDTTAFLVYEPGSVTGSMYLGMTLVGTIMLLFLAYWFWSWSK